MPGVADSSFGVEVAKLAQLPYPVIMRAQDLLENLQMHSTDLIQPAVRASSSSDEQRLKQSIVRLEDEVQHMRKKLAALQQIDYDNLSPKAAFDLLWKIKDL